MCTMTPHQARIIAGVKKLQKEKLAPYKAMERANAERIKDLDRRLKEAVRNDKSHTEALSK